MSVPKGKPQLPPRWFIGPAWFAHRRIYRLTGGRLGLWRPLRFFEGPEGITLELVEWLDPGT